MARERVTTSRTMVPTTARVDMTLFRLASILEIRLSCEETVSAMERMRV